MPDITPAQIVAVVGAIIALAVAFGLNLTVEQQAAITGAAAVIAGLLLHSDAKIRGKRADLFAARSDLSPKGKRRNQ